jgi:large subunit ribosomal protein L3
MTSENNNANKSIQTKSVNKDCRPGLIAEKVGMTSEFNVSGVVTPVTVLKVVHSTIIDHKTVESNGYRAVVVGYGDVKVENLTKPMAGCFKKLGVDPLARVKEFRVGENYQSDSKVLDASHFDEGQFVDVSGVTIGKGFAGVMKRWNFRGLEASHGVSISHRSHGSTGQRQDPGKVFKGKKMAGHMGVKNVKKQNLKILRIDLENGLIIVKGSVPGFKGSRVVITDSKKKIKVS